MLPLGIFPGRPVGEKAAGEMLRRGGYTQEPRRWLLVHSPPSLKWALSLLFRLLTPVLPRNDGLRSCWLCTKQPGQRMLTTAKGGWVFSKSSKPCPAYSSLAGVRSPPLLLPINSGCKAPGSAKPRLRTREAFGELC